MCEGEQLKVQPIREDLHGPSSQLFYAHEIKYRVTNHERIGSQAADVFSARYNPAMRNLVNPAHICALLTLT